MPKPASLLQSYLAAGFIPPLLLIGSLSYCPVSVCREITDHCGRPVENLHGEPLLEIDPWATWLANWPSNLCIILSLLLFACFLYLDHQGTPKEKMKAGTPMP